jgi:predicted type IV restriction endonuclease
MGIDTIKGLVNRFSDHLEEYKSPSYNETQVRRDFIDPFFEALGWDINNKQGFSQTFRQVIHEDSLNVEGSTKAPDYCFQLGGRRVFFVEAKKPAVDLKEDVHPAYQLRRYAWSARLPVSILTDFEEFAVYDCRVKPGPADKASAARVLYLPFNEYPARWDELTGLFSPEAIQKGAIEKYVGSAKSKRGTAQVDDAFLEEIEGWRELLAKSIALRNDGLTQRDLNFAVQRTIDRLIFLRICEDRGIETYATLQEFLNGANIYERLVEYFRRADERYNSGLFHFRDEKDQSETPDTLTPRIAIDDKPLKDILKKLYYPDCPYEFSVLGADILGSVYERFLGKVIRLTAGHRAVVEEKPEVRKAGGVYYTPTYIVDYIVKNTVGKLLEGKTPKQAADLRILDPACGSGSFLLGAYQCLLGWHAEQYVKDPEKWTKGKDPALYKSHEGDWKLTTQERKRILLNNIYGVDIDSQAVEVTKLSLLLKVLEGESGETISKQLKMFHQRALPDLGSNIKCGNSLIGPDFYQQQRMVELTDEDHYRINVFDWDQAFPEIMKRGGFDAVIGNPPYGAVLDKAQNAFIKNAFVTAQGELDSYTLFIEKGLKLLFKNALFSMIVPDTWATLVQQKKLREFILKRYKIVSIVTFVGRQNLPDSFA